MNAVRSSSTAVRRLLYVAIAVPWVVCGLGLAPAARAQTSAQEGALRERIAIERRQANGLFEQRRRDCSQRFAVTACMNEASSANRETIERLGREDELLDSRVRHMRAANRLEIIRQKTEALSRLSPSPAAQPATPRQSAAQQAIGTSSGSMPSSLALETQPAAADRAAAQRASASQKRRGEAQRQRTQRAAQRADRKKSAAALPAYPPIPPVPPLPSLRPASSPN